jgi:hypothetical protein
VLIELRRAKIPVHALEFFEAEFVGAEGTVMHARLLHGRLLLEPAYLDSANAAPRASVAVTINIVFRTRSGDLLLMNAGLAKPIPQYLVHSKAGIGTAQMLAAARA